MGSWTKIRDALSGKKAWEDTESMLYGDEGAAATAAEDRAAANEYRKQYGDVLGTIKGMLPTGQESSPFVTGAQSRYAQISDPNYQAISSDERNRIFNQRKESLYKDVINPEDEKLSAKLALSGQTGGGVASGNWEDKSYQNKRLLSDAYNEIENMGLSQTLSDKSSLLSLAPSLYGMESMNKSAPLNAWSQYAGLLGDEESRILGLNASNSANSAQEQANKGQMMGSIASLIASIF